METCLERVKVLPLSQLVSRNTIPPTREIQLSAGLQAEPGVHPDLPVFPGGEQGLLLSLPLQQGHQDRACQQHQGRGHRQVGAATGWGVLVFIEKILNSLVMKLNRKI